MIEPSGRDVSAASGANRGAPASTQVSPAWHALEIVEILSLLGTDIERGLSRDEPCAVSPVSDPIGSASTVRRLSSSRISNLTCCVRDGAALYGLFADTFGEEHAVLLLDDKATSTAIRREIDTRLAGSGPDDVVFISFSGHGSDCYRLVTHDADPENMSETTIHLDDLTRLFARIPARNVILPLDCCFAGGAGSRVFHEEIATRGVQSTDEILGHVSGAGRVIVTAARPDQEATVSTSCAPPAP